MPAFLLPLLAKLAPYLAMIVAAVSGYFIIKHQGAKAEREKIQTQQRSAIEKRTEEVHAAVEKDAAIDRSVGEKINAVKKPNQSPTQKPAEAPDSFKPGDIFKF
jgi:hypothetical protein